MKPTPDPKRRKRAQRELETDHRPRWLDSDRQLQRISPADERDLTHQVRRAEDDQRREQQGLVDAETVEQRATVNRLIDAADQAIADVKRTLGYVDRDTYRDLDRARQSLRRVKTRLSYTGVTP